MKFSASLLGILTSSLVLVSACSKSDSKDEVVQEITDAVVTASGTLNLVPSIVLASPTGVSSTALALEGTEGAELDDKNPKVAAEALDEVFENATDIKGCLLGLGRREAPEAQVSCYGPAVQYQNHPDGTAMNGTFLPSGDLGVFDATETGGEACVAAKMNQMTGTIRTRVSQSIETGKRVLCFAKVLDKELPTVVGEELDLTADVMAALEANKAEVEKRGELKFTTIKIKLSALADDISTYQTEVAATLPRGSLWTRVVTKKTSDTVSEGYVWGVFERSAVQAGLNTAPQAAETNVYSVLFSKNDDILSYDATRSVAQSEADKAALLADKTSLFESDKRVRVATTGNPGYHHVLAKLDTASGAGEMIFMWTAGGAQEEQRTMHAKISVADSVKTGWGYFGFGAKLSDFRAAVKAGTVAESQASIEKMICNWAGPNNSHTGVAFAQKQVLTLSGDMFIPSTSKIGFAAQNSCGQGGAGANFTVVKGNQNDTGLTFAAWPSFDLIDISAGEDLTNLQSVKSLLIESSL